MIKRQFGLSKVRQGIGQDHDARGDAVCAIHLWMASKKLIAMRSPYKTSVKWQRRRRLRWEHPSKGKVPVLSAAFASLVRCRATNS